MQVRRALGLRRVAVAVLMDLAVCRFFKSRLFRAPRLASPEACTRLATRGARPGGSSSPLSATIKSAKCMQRSLDAGPLRRPPETWPNFRCANAPEVASSRPRIGRARSPSAVCQSIRSPSHPSIVHAGARLSLDLTGGQRAPVRVKVACAAIGAASELPVGCGRKRGACVRSLALS